MHVISNLSDFLNLYVIRVFNLDLIYYLDFINSVQIKIVIITFN